LEHRLDERVAAAVVGWGEGSSGRDE